MAKKSKADDEAQSKRFIDAAREARADETKDGADRAFKRLMLSKDPPKGASKESQRKR